MPHEYVVKPALYRDEWVTRIDRNPWPNSIGLSVSDRVWPEKLLALQDGSVARMGAGEGAGYFLVRWFNRVTGESIAMSWEPADKLRLLDVRPYRMPDAREMQRQMGRDAAASLKQFEEREAALVRA